MVQIRAFKGGTHPLDMARGVPPLATMAPGPAQAITVHLVRVLEPAAAMEVPVMLAWAVKEAKGRPRRTVMRVKGSRALDIALRRRERVTVHRMSQVPLARAIMITLPLVMGRESTIILLRELVSTV